MDIKINKLIYEGLVNYNNSLDNNYGNTILDLVPLERKQFPYTIVRAIRDTANVNYNTCYGRISSKGYRVDIYAQNKGTKLKRNDIAEYLAQQIDKYMGNIVGLDRVSYNAIDLENEGTTYHIIITYSGNLDEYRRKFI